MPFLLIANNQIASPLTDEPLPETAIPTGFLQVETAFSLPIAQLYWDGETVLVKPDRPSPNHYWDETTKEWIAPFVPEPTIAPNWLGLVAALRNSAIWAKVFDAASRTLKAQNAFTLLYGTLITVHNLDDLRLAIYLVREAMRGISAIGDFSADELAWIGDRLSENGFNPGEFDLAPHE